MTDSIETHSLYPFVRVGLAFDFHPWLSDMDPRDHVIDRTDWWLEIEGDIAFGAYSSRQSALDAVARQLFSNRHSELLQRQIEAACASGDMALALRLAEGRGRAQGRREAEATFASVIKQMEGFLAPFRIRE